MGLLDGQLAKQLLAGFQGTNVLQRGTLWRAVPAGGLNADGDPISSDYLTWSFQGFQEDCSDAFRARAGIPELDIKINVFGASLPAGIAPLKDDKAYLIGQWWQMRKVFTDPAKALYICQSFACNTPP